LKQANKEIQDIALSLPKIQILTNWYERKSIKTKSNAEQLKTFVHNEYSTEHFLSTLLQIDFDKERWILKPKLMAKNIPCM
jgi:hypothetical protein